MQLGVDSLGYVYSHAIAIDQSDRVYVIYAQGFPGDFYLKTYKDSVWSDPIQFPNIAYSGGQSMVCDDQGYLHIAYVDGSGITNEIKYIKYNNTTGPSEPVSISVIDSMNSLYPNITLDSENRPHVVWEQYVGTTWPNYNHWEIFYSAFTDTGWLFPVNISNLSQASYKPLILDYMGNIIVFFRTEYDTLPDKDIYYSVSNNNQWNLYRWEVDSSSIIHHYHGIISPNGDTIYMAYQKMLNTWDSDIFFVKGYSNPNSIIDKKNNLPNTFKLTIYPNPFNNQVTIQFYLDKTQPISLKIFNITGKEVYSEITNRKYQGGYHRVTWTGINNNGKEVSSGLYFMVLKGEINLLTKKLILLR